MLNFKDFINQKINESFEYDNLEYFSDFKDLPELKNKEELLKIMKGNGTPDDWLIKDSQFIYDLTEVFYNMSRSNPAADRKTNIINFASKYGKLPIFAVLLSNYNGQVNNGGHSQYWGNGYSSVKRENRTGEIELHELLLLLWDELSFNKFSKAGRLSYDVAKQFEMAEGSESCTECGGDGYYTEEDEDGDSYEEHCYSCNGSGEVEAGSIVADETLDIKLYDVNNNLMADLESFVANKLL